jgi:hypothetical protein
MTYNTYIQQEVGRFKVGDYVAYRKSKHYIVWGKIIAVEQRHVLRSDPEYMWNVYGPVGTRYTDLVSVQVLRHRPKKGWVEINENWDSDESNLVFAKEMIKEEKDRLNSLKCYIEG